MEAPSNEPVSMTTIALDERVDLDATEVAWPERRRYPYARIYSLDEGGAVYLFRFGAVVVEGPPALVGPALEAIQAATGRQALPATRETFRVGFDATGATGTPRVGWDQVVLAERTPERMAAVALLLAQSAALERYEQKADRLLEEAARVAGGLARQGRPPRRTRALLRDLGRIVSDRLELTRWFFLVDRPAETWELPEVAALYDALFLNLELGERHRAMLHKLSAVEGSLETTLSVWRAQWSHRLEWAIVLLIVVEIALALL